MATHAEPCQRDDFEIAIICALQLEADAVLEMFDKVWDGNAYGKARGDRNTYTLGSMSTHNVVLVHMPRMGKATAATAAASLRHSFQHINLALVVGICGGVPNGTDCEKEILLGDVIIGTGLVQYDFGRRFDHGFSRKNVLGHDKSVPNDEVQGFLNKLRSQTLRKRLATRTSDYLTILSRDGHYQNAEYLGTEEDRLFEATYRHKHHDLPTCDLCTRCTNRDDQVCAEALELSCADLKCDANKQVVRQRLTSGIRMAGDFNKETATHSSMRTPKPVIHFGVIASGDTVMKSGEQRDIIATAEGAIAFEMEGAGVWDSLSCLVMKSVCDYADAHKDKKWQGYAAATAAACTKAVLGEWTTLDTTGQSIGSPKPSSRDSPFTTRDIKDCLHSLSFSAIDNRLSSIALPHQDTCEWLLKCREFQQWISLEDLQSHNGVLWLKGKAGAGKSTLAKFTFSKCQESFKNHIIAAYFFNARGGDLEKTPLGMCRSIVYQLIDKDDHLRDSFMLMFLDKQKKHREKWEWNMGELKEFLIGELGKGHFQPSVLLIDALDECNEEEVYGVVSFLELLSETAVQVKASLRILLSSRHYPTIDMRKKLVVAVDRQEGHEKDIRRYVQDKLRAKNEMIEAEILRKASHVFMWVVLVVGILNQECDGRVKAMWRKLNDLPSGLDEVFKILLEKNNPKKKATVLALQWVLFAANRLKPEELYFAILAGTEPKDLGPWDEDEDSQEVIQQFITSTSRGLIEIQGDYVQFIHESVNDFLLRNKRLQTLDPELSDHPVGVSNQQLAGCCMTYLLMRDLEIYADDRSYHYSEFLELFPFANHALVHVFGYSNSAQADHIPQEDFLQHLQQCRLIERIRLHYENVGHEPMDLELGPDLVYALSLYNCYELLQVLFRDNGGEVNAQGGYYGTALQAASFYGSQDIVELLLKSGADVNAQGGEYGTALQAASFRCSQDTVELLLKSGAYVNAQGGKYSTALQAASFHGSQDMVELLLKSGADVNAQGGYYGTALQAASFCGSQEIVELLLKSGANVIAQGGNFGTALQIAKSRGSTAIVDILVKYGAKA